MTIAGGKILDGFLAFQDQLPAATAAKSLTGSDAPHRFAAAMERATTPPVGAIPPAAITPNASVHASPPASQVPHVTQPVRVAANPPATATDATVSSTSPAASADAADRARRALQLDPATPVQKTPESGDRILDGLSKLRSVFDNQQLKLNTMLQQPVGDTQQLMALQVEVVNFSLLVDVSSKLTGKSTQALETLMKGQ